eukprot:COSAG06_NODE_8404_length_2185_cov_3.571908_2_plen_60_part_00
MNAIPDSYVRQVSSSVVVLCESSDMNVFLLSFSACRPPPPPPGGIPYGLPGYVYPSSRG